jgi:metal-sulfur cluster biosynthetic enzyme
MTTTAIDVGAAREVLDGIYDPCSIQLGCPLSLTEMGLVKKVGADGGQVRVSLQLTEPTCMFTFRIAEEIEARMTARFGPATETKVEILGPKDIDEIWDEEEIEPAALARLRKFRAERAADRREANRAEKEQHR